MPFPFLFLQHQGPGGYRACTNVHQRPGRNVETLKGYVSAVIYRNEENTYTVFEINCEGEIHTCTGFPAQISEGESCALEGEFVSHPVYGPQFRVCTYTPCAPDTEQAVFRYLASGAIPGIREATARKILQKFGTDTMKILDEQPERLSEIKGISERKAREIAASLEERRDTRNALMYLQQFALSNQQALRIWNTYGMEMYTVLKENPYRLAEDIDGIGFARADEIAHRLGVVADSEFRIRSGILYCLSVGLSQGNTWIGQDELAGRTAALLQVSADQVLLQIDNLAMDAKIRCRFRTDAAASMPEAPAEHKEEPHTVCVYSNAAYAVEQQIARKMIDLAAAAADSCSAAEIDEKILKLEQNEEIRLDDLQRDAVRAAASGSVLILSGGPGTGKTTTINAIIRYFRSELKTVLLAAPTGRAAKRMSEATGREAMTIHRLLGYRAAGQEPDSLVRTGDAALRFDKGEDNPLEADVIIIDEMSMVDIFLFHALLRAVSPGTRLILVGDAHQLPSVGPGRVLQDLMDSGAFRTIILEKIFRQAARSDIIMNAHRLLQGAPMKLDNHSRDFFFLERSDPKVIYKHTVQLVQELLPRYLNCSPGEIQVLTPMRKGLLGSVRLNEVLQGVLNPARPGRQQITAHDVTFRLGDKVMQTRNNYQMEWRVPGNFGMAVDQGTGIFNGDFGTVTGIQETAGMMEVTFDEGRVVDYPLQDLDDLELAYAITVHKSQGSEYPAVILPLLSGPPGLFYRNLLYTAITRARKCVVILGSRQCVEDMARNVSQNTRMTGLEERIHEILG